MQKNVSTQTKNNFITRRVPMCLEVAQGKLMYIYILDISCNCILLIDSTHLVYLVLQAIRFIVI